MLLEHRKLNPDVVVTSDASGNWGSGAYCKEEWFQLQWDEATKQKHITVKELIPIVVAAALWGESWSGKSVQVRSDNAAVVAVTNSGSSRDPRGHAPNAWCLYQPGSTSSPQQNTSQGFTINWLMHYPEMMLGISCSIILRLSQNHLQSHKHYLISSWDPSNLWSTIFNKD